MSRYYTECTGPVCTRLFVMTIPMQQLEIFPYILSSERARNNVYITKNKVQAAMLTSPFLNIQETSLLWNKLRIPTQYSTPIHKIAVKDASSPLYLDILIDAGARGITVKVLLQSLKGYSPIYRVPAFGVT